MSSQHQSYVPPNGVRDNARRALLARYHHQAQRSVNGQWDRSGRPLDVPRSRQPQNYGTPLPTAMDDRSRANGMGQHAIPQPTDTAPSYSPGFSEMQQPQPIPQVDNLQNWQCEVVDANAGVGDVRQPHILEATNRTLLPTASVSVIKEVIVETQPTIIEMQQSASIIGQRQPSVAIEATEPQTLAAPGQFHTITRNQIMAAAARKELGDGITPERGIDTSEQPSKPRRKQSFRKTLEHAGSKISIAILTALRTGAEEPPAQSTADEVVTGWQTFLSEQEQQQTSMEGAFDSFHHLIQEAMNTKYKELKGEGSFLIDEGTVELQAKEPMEMSVEIEERTAPDEEESMWVTHTKKEEEVTEFCDPYTGSVKRLCLPYESPWVSADYLVCHPPKPRTYPAGSPSPAQVAQPEEPKPAVNDQQNSTPSSKGGSRPIHLEAAVVGERVKTPNSVKGRESKLPRPATGVGGRSVSGHRATSVHANAAQPAEAPKSRTPPKGRKDSVQLVAPQPAQAKERYAKYRHMDRE